MDAILLENNRCNQRAHPNTHWLGPPKSKGLLWTIYNATLVHVYGDMRLHFKNKACNWNNYRNFSRLSLKDSKFFFRDSFLSTIGFG